MKILITGFEAFGDNQLNPSQLVVDHISKTKVFFPQVVTVILPVDTIEAPKKLISSIHDNQPETVICFGLAEGRKSICLENIAINVRNFQIADNSGIKIKNENILKNGPAAYFTNLPIMKLQELLVSSGIQADISNYCGTYICNQVFYTLMHGINTQNFCSQGGFIHLPSLPEQVKEKTNPSMQLDKMIEGVAIILEYLLAR
jgi:pyroglutamyl-peptidase